MKTIEIINEHLEPINMVASVFYRQNYDPSWSHIAGRVEIWVKEYQPGLFKKVTGHISFSKVSFGDTLEIALDKFDKEFFEIFGINVCAEPK